MSKPQSHYFEVEMIISDINSKTLEVKLPVWAPGSYLVREFSKNLNLVKAFSEKGAALKVDKKEKNKWIINLNGLKAVTVKYEVYAFELSVRTSFLDLTHGFISGPGVLMYVESAKNNKGSIEIFPYKEFKTITTALNKATESISKDGSTVYEYENYDQLLDCPIEIGNQVVFDFMAAGTKHTVGIYGNGNYDIDLLKKDMAKICETATNVFGANPNKNYTFIIHNVTEGQGGLEHVNSTTLSVNRWTYQGAEYNGFLSLVAHEYFHLWNVKRIRPIELGPFNYDQENYTTLLWVMEGFTSYYDELLLLRAGYYTEDAYLSKMLGNINYVEGSIGARVQPVAHSSFDAWIKGYRPNENSSNTGMTYYSRGAIIASLIDAMIIEKYQGKKCLDHFLQLLLEKYHYQLKRGFTANEFQKDLEAFLGYSLQTFFDDYINGTKIPDYNQIYSKIGVKVEYIGVLKPSFGANISQNGNQLVVKSIRSGSAAEDAGLSVNDEIIGCNGYRVNQVDLEKVITSLNAGQTMKLLISRDLVLYEIVVNLTNYERPQYKLSFTDDVNTNGNKNYMFRKI
ncbi:MAG: M61 family metallopeptidase [Flavobacteriia bacterium]|nr:M61 family metallopeptidase [Flavobacteriia bacterium]